MKKFTTNKVIVDITTEELENLNALLNQHQLFLTEKLKGDLTDDVKRYYKKMYDLASKLWVDIYKIQKELPF